MKRASVFFAVLFLSGCIGRTYVTDQGKIDFDPVTGERHTPSNDTTDKRKILVWEIEMNKKSSQPKPATMTETAQESTYNVSTAPAVTTPEPAVSEALATPTATAVTPGDKTYTEYTVQKNDTLQKISLKVYGTTKKWQTLYNENKDVLKGPDKLYPGLVIKVPNKQ